jgi:small GTP-binding protein
MATAGLEYFSKDEIIDGKKVKVKIWDTAGQEQYKSLTRNFYRNSNGVVIVYDVTSRKTFNTVKDWISSINDAADKDIKIILVGNKIDLPREVTNEEGRNMAQKFNIKFFETSAKDNIGITESIKDIALMVLNSNKKNSGGLDIVTHPENSRSCKC